MPIPGLLGVKGSLSHHTAVHEISSFFSQHGYPWQIRLMFIFTLSVFDLLIVDVLDGLNRYSKLYTSIIGGSAWRFTAITRLHCDCVYTQIANTLGLYCLASVPLAGLARCGGGDVCHQWSCPESHVILNFLIHGNVHNSWSTRYYYLAAFLNAGYYAQRFFALKTL